VRVKVKASSSFTKENESMEKMPQHGRSDLPSIDDVAAQATPK